MHYSHVATRVLMVLLFASLFTTRAVLPTHAATNDFVADAVLGQIDFTTRNYPLQPNATTLDTSWSIAIDPQSDRLYVSDFRYNRVLSWPSAANFTNGQAADLVFGQPDFTSQLSGSPDKWLSQPTGIAVDDQGGLYVVNGQCNIFRYDTPTADQTVDAILTEQNTPAVLSGLTTGDRRFCPIDLAFDTKGALSILDGNNSRVVRLVNPRAATVVADAVFTVSSPTFRNNHYVQGVAIDAHGVLYVSDLAADLVFAFTDTTPGTHIGPDRVIGGPLTNVRISGVTATGLNDPNGLAVDSEGNLFIADQIANRVVYFNTPVVSDAVADAVFGQPDFTTSASTTSAQGLGGASDIAVDRRGNLYVADLSNHRVVRYDTPLPYGNLRINSLRPATVAAGDTVPLLTVGGTNFTPTTVVRWNGTPLPTTFVNSYRMTASVPASLLQSPGQATITVGIGNQVSAPQPFVIYSASASDTVADRVLGQATFTDTMPNAFGIDAAGLQAPNGIAVDGNGRVYVADTVYNRRILSWPSSTAFSNGQQADLIIPQPDTAAPQVYGKLSYWVSSISADKQGNLYVLDGKSRVVVYRNPAATDIVPDRILGQPDATSTGCNTGGISASTLCDPLTVAVDRSGNVYVTDTSNKRVLEYNMPLTSDAVADRVFGQPNFTSNTAQTTISASSVFGPIGVALDGAGNLYIADAGNNRVLQFDAPLTSDTVADRVFGQPNMLSGSSNNGGVSASSLGSADAVAADARGNVYITDGKNARILAYRAPLTSDTVADVVFNQLDFQSSARKPASQNTMYSPGSLTTDAQGNLFVADWVSNRVLEFDSPLVREAGTIRLYLPLTRR